MQSLYDFRDYKEFLCTRSAAHGQRSGFKSRLARACGCNSAYISSVLSGKAHLSLEQAERACAFLELNGEEADYFLLLVQRARAGTVALAVRFDRHIESALKVKLNVQKRLGAREKLSKEDQSRYYSSWMYAAIHVALAIPHLAQSPAALAKYFDLPLTHVEHVLGFLERTGLAERRGSGGGYGIGNRHIHLGAQSENISRHHCNWRLQAVRASETARETDLLYSSAVTLSRDDAFKVRELLLQAIRSSAEVILRSPEEEVFALAVDFFSLGRDAP